MLEKTHERIAEKIGKKLKLGKKELDLLKLGSTRPDSLEPLPHHRGQEERILHSIILARSLFLEGDDEAYVKLGEALHFIADQWTTHTRSSEKHAGWEQRIERAEILDERRLRKLLKATPMPERIREFYGDLLEALEGIAANKNLVKACELFSDFFPEDYKKFYRRCEIIVDPESLRILSRKEWEEVLGRNKSTLEAYNSFRDRLEKLRREAAPLSREAVEYYVRASCALGEAEDWVLEKEKLCKLTVPGKYFLPALVSEKLASMREGYSTPELDLNFAYRLCHAIASIVLSRDVVLAPGDGWSWNEPLSKGVEKEKERAERERKKRLERLEENLGKLEEAAEKRKEESREKRDCCIIATCALPSQHPNLQYLRRFRDDVLRPTRIGRLIIWAYYALSPPLALLVLSSKRVKNFVRRRFIPFWIGVCREWERQQRGRENEG